MNIAAGQNFTDGGERGESMHVDEGHACLIDADTAGPLPLENTCEDGMRWYAFWDDVNGRSLQTEMVRHATKEEFDCLHHHG